MLARATPTYALALVASALAACAGSGTYRAQAPSVPVPAERLIALLPEGAQECAVAWPGRVPAARRSLVRRIAHAAPTPWDGRAPFAVWAEGKRRTASGRTAFVAVVRVSDMEAARRYLTESAPVRVRWDDRPACPGPDCWDTYAVPIDDRTVRIGRGPWAGRDSARGPGVEARCAQLARTEGAIEVAARLPHWNAEAIATPGQSLFENLGYSTQSTLVRSGRGLSWREEVHAQDVDVARDVARLAEMESNVVGSALDLATHFDRTVENGDLITTARFSWTDLEMASQDERYWREALADEARGERPIAVERVDLTDRPLLEAQVDLRRTRVVDGSGAQRLAEAGALRRLLELALMAYPDDFDFAKQLTRLLLDPLRDGDAARALTERMFEQGARDDVEWRLLHRHALAQSDERALARALVADEVVPRADASEAAAALTALAESDYEPAEGAWLTSRAMQRGGRPVRSVPTASLPLGSLVETLLALAEERDAPTLSVHVRIASGARLPTGAEGLPMERVYTWDSGEGSIRVGAGMTDAPDGLRGLSQNLVAGLREGPLRVAVALVPIGGDLTTPEARIEVVGELEDGGLTLRESDRRDVRWPEVVRYLATPLEGLTARLFPPPEMEVDVPPEQLDALLERADQDQVLLCGPRGDRIHCTVAPDRLVTRRAWRALMSPFIDP